MSEELNKETPEVIDEPAAVADNGADVAPSAPAAAPKKKLSKWKKGLLIAACSLLGLLLALSLFVVIFAGGKLKLINRGSNWRKLTDQEMEDFLNSETEPVPADAVVVDPGDIQWGDNPAAIENGDGVVNILLIGLDRRGNERYSRSDTMILCTLNKHNNTLTLTSLMRDMYVQIPGYYSNRINAAYVFGGADLLKETLELNFGVQVDYTIEVDMVGFCLCIDEMGGIDVTLTQAEANYLNNCHRRVSPDEPAWNLTAGTHCLTGEQALFHARNRTTGNGDFDRTSRQRAIMTAAYNKAKTMNLVQINDLLNKLLPHLTTDMTNREIVEQTLTVFSLFDKLQLKTCRLPADGTYYPAWVSSMSVLIPDLEANSKILADIMKAE